MDKVKVSLVRAHDPFQGVRKVIEILGPQDLSIKGSHVLVKPNLCSPFPPEEAPQITHPDVVGALVRYLKEEGARKVVGTKVSILLRKERCQRGGHKGGWTTGLF
jgi:uncharacterized protein (DUF362 family)